MVDSYTNQYAINADETPIVILMQYEIQTLSLMSSSYSVDREKKINKERKYRKRLFCP
jgi:hypothetical protein